MSSGPGLAADSAAPRVLPRGRHGLARDVVQTSQRERLLEAVTEVTAEKGYAAVTIGDIVSRAGIARRTFYEHFSGKEQCFLAAFSRAADQLIATITEPFDAALDIITQTDIAIRGLLGFLAGNPVAARVYLVEVNAAGPAAVAARLEVHRRIAATLVALGRQVRRAHPQTPQLGEQHALAVVGAVHELIDQALQQHGPEQLTGLAGQLVPLTANLLSAGPHPVPRPHPGPGKPRTPTARSPT